MDFSKLKDMGRKYVDKARQIAEGLTELEIKVEEATNDDKWGPHGQLMAEITKESFREEEYKEILAVLARRLASEPNKWRRVYKSLLLLEYMAKNGPERMVAELKSNQNVFNRLQTFEFIDDAGKDQGLNVRNRAKELWNLVNDPDHIAHERERAGANKNKYAGFDARSLNSNVNAGARVSGGSSRSGGFPGATEPPRSSDGEDPVEATRKRLAALKAAEEEAAAAAASAPADAPVPQKKKLSDVKVDSSIAATLAKNFKTLAPTTSAPSAPASTGPDLLAFDEVPSSAPAAASAGDDWASFASAPPAKAAPAPAPAPAVPAAKAADPFAAVAAGDEWSNFASAAAPTSTAADPLAGLSVVAPPPASSDPFASMATGTTAAATDPFTPSSRAELPADIFSAPVVAPIPTFPQPVPGNFAAMPPTAGMQMPVAAVNAPLGMMGSGSMQYSPAGGMQGMMPPAGPGMMPSGPAMPGFGPPGAIPGMVAAGVGMPPVKPVASNNMGGPTAMQMPAPLKKDPFADLF